MKGKLRPVYLKSCSTKWSRCGALRFEYVKAVDLFALLYWTSGGFKKSEQSVCKANVFIEMFSSYSYTRFMDSAGGKLTGRCWHLSHILTVKSLSLPESQRMAIQLHTSKSLALLIKGVDSLVPPYTFILGPPWKFMCL